LDTFNVSICGNPTLGTLNSVNIDNTTDQVCIDYTADGTTAGTDTICIVVCDQVGLCDTVTIPIVVTPNPELLKLNAKVYLSGPFVSADGLMQDKLREKGLIPLNQPYNTFLDIAYFGTEIVNPSVFNVTGPNAIVDWILVELRDENDPTILVERRAGLLQRDGDIVEINGYSPLCFTSPESDYFVSVKHRNHLGCMTETPVPMTLVGSTIDFTLASTPTYKISGAIGSDHARQTLLTGEIALWPGNFNGFDNSDHKVKYQGAGSDIDGPFFEVLTDPTNSTLVPVHIVTNTYNRSDGDLNGEVIYQGAGADIDLIFFAVGLHPENVNVLPIYIIYEQIPE